MRKVLVSLVFLFMFAFHPAHAMQYFQTQGSDGLAALIPPNSDYINNYALTGGVVTTVTWPTTTPVANYAIINCAAPPYYTSLQSGMTVPSSTVTTGLGGALNSAQRRRSAGETAFYIIATASQECSVEFWGGK